MDKFKRCAPPNLENILKYESPVNYLSSILKMKPYMVTAYKCGVRQLVRSYTAAEFGVFNPSNVQAIFV